MRNAVDAGSLNVGKRSFELKIKPESAEEHEFDDVLDSKGELGLANINRMWSKALLVAINVAAMQSQGTHTGSASENASKIFDAAKALSTRLADKLENSINHHGPFLKVATLNSVRMLGGETKVDVKPGDGWRRSFLDRAKESNIYFLEQQFPEGFDKTVLGAPIDAKDGKKYYPGYKPMTVLNKTFYLVPFVAGERTQLVARSYFDDNTLTKKPLAAWDKPLANAFSVESQTKNHKVYGQLAMAFVKVNPQQRFPLEMRHGFVKITLPSNKLNWYVNGIKVTNQDYDFFPGQVKSSGSWPVPTGGTISAQASVGNEFIPPTLGQAIMGFGLGSTVKNTIMQRVREIKADYTEGDLMSKLNACPLIPGMKNYIILRIGDELMVLPKEGAQAAASAKGFSVNGEPEGKEKTIDTTTNPPNVPNFVLPIPVVVGVGEPVIGPFSAISSSEHIWKPGSGHGGCLGELTVKRTTDAYISGMLIPPPI